MLPKKLILLAIFSLVLGAILQFNQPSIFSFVLFTLMVAASVFSIFVAILSLLAKERNLKRFAIFMFVGIVLTLILILTSTSLCATAITPAHFRTNVFTGECSYGGYAPCVEKDPWYYQQGCDISETEKQSLIEESGYTGYQREIGPNYIP